MALNYMVYQYDGSRNAVVMTDMDGKELVIDCDRAEAHVIFDEPEDAGIQMALLGISAAFAKYFSRGKANPRKDMYMMTSCTLTLTDDEFKDFLAELTEIATKYMSKPVTEKSVSRQISLVSSPVNQ